MQQMNDAADDPIEAAADLARDVAPELESVLITLFPDAETLDMSRPGDTDVAAANAVARAVAGIMAEEGVEVIVQRADRGAFRRWLAAREDTADMRRRWVDRGRLLRGKDAFRALGLPAPPPEPPPQFPPAPGPVAEELLAAWDERENGEFHHFADALVEAGRGDVLDLAVRKIRARQSDENAAELAAELLASAGGAAVGPSGWAELVALPVALAPGVVPDATALADALSASGALPPEQELRALPGWRSPDAVAELSPLVLRRILLDIVGDREPRDLPPGDTDELAQRGFGVLVGVRLDWDIPVWDVIAAEGGIREDAAEHDTPEELARGKALDRWRSDVARDHGGCVPLDLVPLCDTGAVIADFLEEAGTQVEGLDEIRTFIEAARRKAAGLDVVCRPQVMGGALELTLYTTEGGLLDVLTLAPDQLPAPAEDMLGLIGAFVRLVRDPPLR
jgi:hypothetical protein